LRSAALRASLALRFEKAKRQQNAQVKLGHFVGAFAFIVTSSGFEPKSSEPESEILSIEL
jgi:hypothetical protein